jgi:hypothetical protein
MFTLTHAQELRLKKTLRPTLGGFALKNIRSTLEGFALKNYSTHTRGLRLKKLFNLRSGASPFDLHSGAPPFDLRLGTPPFDLCSRAPPFDLHLGALPESHHKTLHHEQATIHRRILQSMYKAHSHLTSACGINR